VSFTVDAFPDRTFGGNVVQIRNAPTNYQNVVAYDTVIGVENPDMKLKPGMTATVSIVIAERKNALKVPNAALRFRPPETLAPKEMKITNAAPAATNAARAFAQAGAGQEGGRPGGFGSGRGPGGGQGRGGPGGGAGRGGPGHQRQMFRTVYIMADKADKSAKPKPVQIKVGISDGVSTEVLDGLSEGDQVITGLETPSDQSSGARPPNPFGGGGFPRRM
jgi:HlyD family secretion protein